MIKSRQGGVDVTAAAAAADLRLPSSVTVNLKVDNEDRKSPGRLSIGDEPCGGSEGRDPPQWRKPRVKNAGSGNFVIVKCLSRFSPARAAKNTRPCSVEVGIVETRSPDWSVCQVSGSGSWGSTTRLASGQGCRCDQTDRPADEPGARNSDGDRCRMSLDFPGTDTAADDDESGIQKGDCDDEDNNVDETMNDLQSHANDDRQPRTASDTSMNGT